MAGIKIDISDKYFSYYIRLKQGQCQRCHSLVVVNLETGMPVSHNASHYFGRGKENTRFDPENVDCLCFGCHKIWGSDDREGYRAFKIKQLGEEGFQALTIRSYQYKAKDRKMALIQAHMLLRSVFLEV